jgi:SAM-dependent methyltransferase
LSTDPYYQRDLALVHHRGFGFHASACAPGIIQFLAPVRERGGLVAELGCGTGLLTAELIAAGHRVIATDASPAMLEIAREVLGDTAQEIRRLTLPEDLVPDADAIVAVGHPLNYLPDAASFDRALIAVARALRPGGLIAIDVCDLEWGRVRQDAPNLGWAGHDWAIITEFAVPSPDRFVRDMTTFVPAREGLWRRASERHENVLVDTAAIPELLGAHGVYARMTTSFGTETLPDGLRVVLGHKQS